MTALKEQMKIFFSKCWSNFPLDLLIDMLIDLLLTINTGQDIHDMCGIFMRQQNFKSMLFASFGQLEKLLTVWSHYLVHLYDNTEVSSTVS